MLEFLGRELNDLKKRGLIRQFNTITDIRGSQVKINDRWYTSFCSNDYLGLLQHARVRHAAKKIISKLGVGSGASRLMSGTFLYHKLLEQEIARFKKAHDALLFTSGYAANLGVITTVIKEADIIFCDELNHASLIDACRLTKARLCVYKHCDSKGLEKLLILNKKFKKTRKYIITDSIFSMDGDAAPLKGIVKLAKKYNATTIVDEAHGTGVLGKHGRGLAEHLGVENKIDISIGTLSKALGTMGGFVTGSRNFISYIRSKSRPFIFTTALPAGVCAASIEGLRVLRGKFSLREKLWSNTNYIKRKLSNLELDMRGSESPIIPIMIGDAKKTLKIAQYLWNKGLFAPAIRPPTVPEGESRLRITITAVHNRKELDLLVRCLKKVI